MALFNLKKFGGYKALVKCPNCGFDSEVTVPKGVSVQNFVDGGKCKCDNCQVVFYPDEYTTEYFDTEIRKAHSQIKRIINKKYKPYKSKPTDDIKW